MRIHERELGVGAALAQLVGHPLFTTLDRDLAVDGLYCVNGDRRLLIKHTHEERDEGTYVFTFTEGDLEVLLDADAASPGRAFVALVCGLEIICALSVDELACLIDLESFLPQWVTVVAQPGSRLQTDGPLRWSCVVPIDAFPSKMLAPAPETTPLRDVDYIDLTA